jgi:hypothetical protein
MTLHLGESPLQLINNNPTQQPRAEGTGPAAAGRPRRAGKA